MATLSIRDDGTGALWRVWPDPEEIPPGTVRETGSYLFELSEEGNACFADLLIDDAPLEALRCKSTKICRWRWSPGFHAGMVEVELRLPGNGVRRFEVVTDPDLRKLTRANFDEMVREILEDTFALFSLSSFRKSVARGVGGQAPAIARLEFLRSRIDGLEVAAKAIAQRPQRLLSGVDVAVPYYRAVRATGAEIIRSFRSGRILSEKKPSGRLPATFNGFLPEQIRLRRRQSSLDLTEHRQIAACLRAWSAWLTVSGEWLDRASGAIDADTGRISVAWAARCRRLALRLDRIGELPPFAEAANAPARLMLTSIFRNDPVYRQFFRLSQDMNLGIAAVFGDFLGMPLARTFELYELWCFLRLIRAAAEEYGSEDLDVGDLFIGNAAGGVTLAVGAVTVPIGSGWKLCFQKQFREFWLEPGGCGSFSRIMKPDVVMECETDENTAGLIVLDAKYRIEDGLAEALNSIHTYSHALVRQAETDAIEGVVTAAYLLAPQLPELEENTGYRDTAMPGRLFHPEYRRNFRFGAVTLRPGMTTIELATVLRTIVADATE